MVAHSTGIRRAEAPLRARPTLGAGPAVLVVAMVLLNASPELHEGLGQTYAHKALRRPCAICACL